MLLEMRINFVLNFQINFFIYLDSSMNELTAQIFSINIRQTQDHKKHEIFHGMRKYFHYNN